jgi:predicted nucleic acid-binding protein
VVFETVFTLERTYRRPKSLISEGVQSLLELRGIELPGKRLFIRVFELYASLNIPFADAYHAALMEQRKLTEILTFDRDFDRIPGIQRIEP